MAAATGGGGAFAPYSTEMMVRSPDLIRQGSRELLERTDAGLAELDG